LGLGVLFVKALLAMAFASKNSALPSPTAVAQATYHFVFAPDEHIKGAQNTKVTIVEFSDFQCPACKAYFPIVEEVLKAYPNDVRLVYKHFPLRTIHFRAEDAAFASEAASNQGKFWEMYSKLFDNQDTWVKESGTASFEKYAGELGLDVAKFKADFDSSAVKEKVRAAEKFGVDLGINSTPSFYVNEKKIENPQSLDEFKAVIDQAIKDAK
jgi:protein-disulfide isomerase